MVADFGYQNEQSFLVVDGPREYLVDDDLDFALVGSSVNIVDKSTGDVVFWSHECLNTCRLSKEDMEGVTLGRQHCPQVLGRSEAMSLSYRSVDRVRTNDADILISMSL